LSANFPQMPFIGGQPPYHTETHRDGLGYNAWASRPTLSALHPASGLTYVPDRSERATSVNRGAGGGRPRPRTPFCGRKYPVTLLRLCALHSGHDADPVVTTTTFSGFRLSRLAGRAFRLYCSSQSIGRSGCRKSASNEPGSVRKLPRHFFYIAFPRSCQPLTWQQACQLGPAIVAIGATRMAKGHLHLVLTAAVVCPSRK
jgi:hypothetical protein